MRAVTARAVHHTAGILLARPLNAAHKAGGAPNIVALGTLDAFPFLVGAFKVVDLDVGVGDLEAAGPGFDELAAVGDGFEKENCISS